MTGLYVTLKSSARSPSTVAAFPLELDERTQPQLSNWEKPF